ncbi:MAG TPA: amino acid adenylation domain-containing protein, partial [Acidobacteriaceae bacterium]|nr:amino acid adenylation domain-containing protein [Acidobacteriaceae bacterium]
RIAGWLQRGQRAERVGILASRSVETYAGVLGTLWAGAAYVPVNPDTPEERLIRILETAQLDALIADAAGLSMLTDRVLAHAPRRILWGGKPGEKTGQAGSPATETFDQLPDEGPDAPVTVPDEGLVYILFTSGTTGTPKGVMIEAGSVVQFLRIAQDRCDFRKSDRFSQMSELTFDASVLDMYSAWGVGASVHVVPKSQLIAPAKFIREHELTVWFGVPSTGAMMERMKMLKPGSFPSLRVSIFAGEALPVATALAWKAAAPNSVVENFYGPTELTVDCIAQKVDDPPLVTPNRGTVAIGRAFPWNEAAVVDADLRFVPPETDGELVVAGRQVARGYLGDPKLTAERFPTIDGRRWYRTGDLVRQDADGVFHHLGRIDNQVKVLGNRVELEEVEAHVREITGSDAVAIAWPWEDGRAMGIAVFHCAAGVTRDTVREQMQKRVPIYMVPSRIVELESLPMSSSSGKVDRKALQRMLEESGSPAAEKAR